MAQKVVFSPGWPTRFALAILGILYAVTLFGLYAVPGPVLAIFWLIMAICLLAGQ